MIIRKIYKNQQDQIVQHDVKKDNTTELCIRFSEYSVEYQRLVLIANGHHFNSDTDIAINDIESFISFLNDLDFSSEIEVRVEYQRDVNTLIDKLIGVAVYSNKTQVFGIGSLELSKATKKSRSTKKTEETIAE